MKNMNLLVLSMLFSAVALAGDGAKTIGTVIIEQNLSLKPSSTMEFQLKGSSTDEKEIWSSESGIKCSIGAYEEVAKASVECNGPNNYKVQATVNCAINKSKDTSSYLFVGIVGKSNAHRNFYFYCK